jgi:hypothetical protein
MAPAGGLAGREFHVDPAAHLMRRLKPHQ